MGSPIRLSNVSKLDRYAFHSPPWPLLFLGTSTHIYALSIHSLICKGNVGKSISTASDDRNECKAHDSLPIRGEYRKFRKFTFG